MKTNSEYSWNGNQEKIETKMFCKNVFFFKRNPLNRRCASHQRVCVLPCTPKMIRFKFICGVAATSTAHKLVFTFWCLVYMASRVSAMSANSRLSLSKGIKRWKGTGCVYLEASQTQNDLLLSIRFIFAPQPFLTIFYLTPK